jgi:choline dehydrogenase-like flavoprotein
MFLDARTIDDAAKLDADLCVIGGGAAGLTIAQSLRDSGIRVMVVESGDVEPDHETQELAAGTNSGRPYFDLDATRLRFLGGTTNHWGGRCVPLTPEDLSVRDWIPHSGWPIGFDEMETYCALAHEVIGLGPYRYDAAFLAGQIGEKLLGFHGDVVRTVMTRTNALRFGEAFRDDLGASANVTVLLNANVLTLEADASGRNVARAQVATLGGKRMSIRARMFVAACGGIENPRLLLLSQRAGGHPFGNDHDKVGRFFMEHMLFSNALLVLPAGAADHGIYGATIDHDGAGLQATLAFHPEFLARERLPNLYFELEEQRGYGFSEGVEAVSEIVRSMAALQWPGNLGGRAAAIAGDLDVLVDGATERLLGRRIFNDRPPLAFRLRSLSEQVPNPDSRVTLGTTLDRFGLPTVDLAWRTTGQDIEALRRSFELVAREAGRAGIGRVRLDPEEEGEVPMPSMRGGHHHMGTTRMSDDPRLGVVDGNGRVHGMGNLYMAGSSVFPTGGYGNPTLTIVALALRLAEHLRKEMA